MYLEELKKIGEGGQGSAYLCRDLDTGKKVVAKRTHSFETQKRGYAREVYILRDCLPKHPNILRMVCFNQGKELETVYEFCDKGSLQDRIPRAGDKYVEEKFLWHILGQVAQALAFIHHGYDLSCSGPKHLNKDWRKQIIHRDLSPDNLFLRSNKHGYKYPDVVLGDFGYATTERYTETNMKAAYQPPEYPLMTAAADVWALGVIIHRLGCARGVIADTPRGWSYYDWVEQPEARKPRDLPKHYSAQLNIVMWACLERKQRRRIDAIGLVKLIKYYSPVAVVYSGKSRH